MSASLRSRGAFLRNSVGTALAITIGITSGASAAERPQPDLEDGRAAYGQYCARCHGDTGAGDGVDAKRFYPRPRDLKLGVYKFRSTASGTPPADEDLFRTLTNGLPGTNMPDWRHLDEATRWQLVYYLKSLSPVFETQPQPITLSGDPGAKQADLKKGRQVYEQLGCAACHGAQGRANGMSSAGLVDDWGMKIRPANLTKGWTYRGGSDPQSIMMRFMAGIDGAGMPSYVDATTPEDAWQLSYYVASLQEPAHWNYIARASHDAAGLPTAIDDPRWAKAERTDVRARNTVTPNGEWANPPTVQSVSFRVIANTHGAAFLITWDDPSQEPAPPVEGEAAAPTEPDALALVLRPHGAAGDNVTLQAWPYRGAPDLDLLYWSAETNRAVEAVADSYDAVRGASPAGLASLTSASSYQDGRRTLLLHRLYEPGDPHGAGAIHPHGLTAVAFTVWDGGTGSQAVTPWVDVAVEPLGRKAH